MKDHFICISNLHPLDPETISRSLNILLCNDATDPQLNASIMTSPNFKPESFSVLDRMSNNAFLSEGERDFDQWLGLLVQRKLASSDLRHCRALQISVWTSFGCYWQSP
jgi:hypothetical protein